MSSLFHDTVSALLLRRLREALSPPSADCILECFDDHDRLSAPSLSCRYVETTPPERYPAHAPEAACPEGSPLQWHTWLSITQRGGESRCPRPRHTTPTTPEEEPAEEEVQTKDVTIEEGAADVSLTFRALIETEGPAALPTLLVVWEQVLAVSREWFARAAAATDEAVERGGCSSDAMILWFGAERHCGVRVAVRALGGEEPVLVAVEEQPAVSYRMEYDGEFSGLGLLCGDADGFSADHAVDAAAYCDGQDVPRDVWGGGWRVGRGARSALNPAPDCAFRRLGAERTEPSVRR